MVAVQVFKNKNMFRPGFSETKLGCPVKSEKIQGFVQGGKSSKSGTGITTMSLHMIGLKHSNFQ
jgi:hypothetical protein